MSFRLPLVYRCIALSLLIGPLLLTTGCRRANFRTMEVTAYCGCSECCSWTRGNWKYLKLDVWNRYYDGGPNKGANYTGRTASGTKPRQPQPGLVSWHSITHPWMIPFRAVFPWCWLPQKGTIAADTDHYPFGTEIYVPGYGWGVVEDRGSAIQGANRLDIYYRSHRTALQWGRKTVETTIMVDD